jgi:Myb/SANT-like DNA-binding domain
MRALSGFGWDEENKMVTASDDVWTSYIRVSNEFTSSIQFLLILVPQAHPDAAIWRTKPFPLYDEIAGLVEGRYATGEGALHMPEMYDNSSNVGDNWEDPAVEEGGEVGFRALVRL